MTKFLSLFGTLYLSLYTLSFLCRIYFLHYIRFRYGIRGFYYYLYVTTKINDRNMLRELVKVRILSRREELSAIAAKSPMNSFFLLFSLCHLKISLKCFKFTSILWLSFETLIHIAESKFFFCLFFFGFRTG